MTVIILSTPFHLYMISKNKWIIKGKKLFVFYSIFIDKKEIIELFSEKDLSLYQIPYYDLSNHNKKRISMKRWLHLRTYYFTISSLIKKLLNKDEINTLISFSDISIFDQVVISFLKKKEIISIDEGAGHYDTEFLSDKVKNVVFQFSSFFLFSGFVFRYIKVLGTHPKINKVYLRRPDLLKVKIKNKIYYKLDNENAKQNKRNISTQNKVLLLTDPFIEDNRIDENSATALLDSVIDILLHHSCKIDLKPHPREEIEKYSKFINNKNINLILNVKKSEDLDYFKYSKIIHFCSSAIIDVLAVEYPPNNIITIVPNSSFNSYIHVFENTRIINRPEQLQNLI